MKKMTTKEKLFSKLFQLTGCKTVRGTKRKITIIERNYDNGLIPATKEGWGGGRVMSDQYQQWAHHRTEAEEIIKDIENL